MIDYMIICMRCSEFIIDTGVCQYIYEGDFLLTLSLVVKFSTEFFSRVCFSLLTSS